MDEKDRKRIGLFFNFDKNWIGGAIYMMNIIRALKVLPTEKKPELVLFYSEDNIKFLTEIKEINYDFISYIEYSNKKGRIVNYLKSFLSRKNQFITDEISNANLYGLFPLNDFPVKTRIENCKIASWFPDFQHKFYPQYFSKTNLLFRELRFRWVFKKTDTLVLSSQDAFSHYKKFYPDYPQDKVNVVPFVSIIDDLILPDIADVLAMYEISKPYFMVSNQFYEHKNHILVFKAINNLKSKHPNLLVVFTGRMEDYKNPKFIEYLKKYIAENELEQFCKFLSVLPRVDQLALMKNSIAVIQPSKFEGWSTVVEDAKSLQGQIIASDLGVHIEQLGDRAYYFTQENENELIEMMDSYINKSLAPKDVFKDYHERISTFGNQFLKSFN